MHFGNRDYELADARFEQERAAGVKAVQSSLAGGGRADCIDCHDPIEPARRIALPSAIRCAFCQHLTEAGR